MFPEALVGDPVNAPLKSAPSDYALILAQTTDDAILRDLMLQAHAFEASKRGIDARRATKFGPTLIVGTKASLCLVIDQRCVFVVVDLVTESVRVVSDERRV